MTDDDLNPTEADRLTLLDRLADRIPELDLSEHSVNWTNQDELRENWRRARAGETLREIEPLQ